MLPAWGLRVEVDVLTPAVDTDAYGDDTDDWTNPTVRTITASISPLAGSETFTAAGDQRIVSWTLITNDTGIGDDDRIRWGDQTFDIYGTPNTFRTHDGRIHHVEAALREVEG